MNLLDIFKAPEYDTKFTIYKNGIIKIRKYKHPIKQESKGKQGIRKTANENGKISETSLQRTRKNIIDTITNNEDKFLSFITLTFAENITDPNEAYGYLRKFIRRIKDKMDSQGKEFYYIFVPELQKRGAIHFHGLTNIELGSEIIPKRPKLKVRSKGKGRVLEFYNLPYWSETIKGKKEDIDNNSLGYSSAVPIKKEFEEFNVGLYMAKYLTKGMEDTFFGHQKVLKSKNLDTAIVHSLNSQSIKENDFIRQFELKNKDNQISSFLNDKAYNDKAYLEYQENTYSIANFDYKKFNEDLIIAYGIEYYFKDKEKT